MSQRSKTTDSFWNFSLDHYAQPGVEEACLALQNRYGLDVNILLFCVWFGTSRGEIPQPLFHAMLNFSREWSRQVVTPLRQVRTWIKSHRESAGPPESDLDTLRAKIKALELEAEKLLQAQLSRLSGSLDASATGSPEAVRGNLAGYLQWQQLDSDPELAQLLRVVAGAVTESR